jgi:hypothetical protein
LARVLKKESRSFSGFLSSHLTLLHRCVSNGKSRWDIGLMVRKIRKGQTDNRERSESRPISLIFHEIEDNSAQPTGSGHIVEER